MTDEERTPDQLAAEAKFLGVALHGRLVTIEDVRDWANSVIDEHQPSPAMWPRILRRLSRSDRLLMCTLLGSIAGTRGQGLLTEGHLARLFDLLADVIDSEEVDLNRIQLALEAIWMTYPERSPQEYAIRLRQRIFERTWAYHRQPSQALADLRAWLRAQAESLRAAT